MYKRQWHIAMLLIFVASIANASDYKVSLSKEAQQALVKDIDLLKTCLEKGMKPSNDLLECAVRGCNMPAIELLVSFGADVHNNYFAFFLAVEYAIAYSGNSLWYQKHIQIVKYMLKHGANPLATVTVKFADASKFVETSGFQFALEKGDQQIIGILKEHIKNNVKHLTVVS